MKQPESLRLADELEDALESHDGSSLTGRCQGIADDAAAELRRLHEANQAMLEALNCINHKPAQQEPVAWLVVSKYSGGRRLDVEWNIDADAMAFALGRLPLYTTPQAQRTLVEVEQVKWDGNKLLAKHKENT